jgi:hypothetical protein
MPDLLEEESTRTIDPVEDQVMFDRVMELVRTFVKWMYDHRDKVKISYLLKEQDWHGWYVYAKQPAFDFALNKELTEFSFALIRKGYPIHAILLPGSVPVDPPPNSIVFTPTEAVLHAQRA